MQLRSALLQAVLWYALRLLEPVHASMHASAGQRCSARFGCQPLLDAPRFHAVSTRPAGAAPPLPQ